MSVRETYRLAAEVHRAYRGDTWHGPSIGELLADVDAAVAASRPIPEAHTIWEIVLHVTAWVREVARRLEGVEPGLPTPGDWPPVPKPTAEAWEATRAALARAHEELRDALERFPEAQLDELVGEDRSAPLGTGVSYYRMLHGLMQHDAYHAGQIALLKKAVRAPGD
ncbi:MAG TPA: DinB family protein [Gemmatimonadales bacterium]|nr:DinB family protein [Gemmatimonadales bacterium]